MEKFVSPFQTFLGLDNLPIALGKLYIGTANTNPITNPVSVYWNAEATIPAPNPIRIKNGMIYNNNTPAVLFVTGDVSFAILDESGEVIVNYPTMDSGLSIPISRVTVDTDLDMASHKITSLANATVESDAVNLAQVRNESYRTSISQSALGVNLRASFSPPVTSLVDGMELLIKDTSFIDTLDYGFTFTPNYGIVPAKELRLPSLEYIPSNFFKNVKSFKVRYLASANCWVTIDIKDDRILNIFSDITAHSDSLYHTLELTVNWGKSASVMTCEWFNGLSSPSYPTSSYYDLGNLSYSSITIPFGATLGTKSTIPSTLALFYVFDIANSISWLGVSNANGVSFDESSFIDTYELTSASLDSSKIYTSTPLTNCRFRLIALIDSTQTIAGQWDSAPTNIRICHGDTPNTTKSTVCSAWTTPIPGTAVQLEANHSLGTFPFKVTLEFKCLTAEHGYSIDDIVECNQFGTYMTVNLWKSPTKVGAGLPASNDFKILNKTTGALATPTKANWAYRFLLTR